MARPGGPGPARAAPLLPCRPRLTSSASTSARTRSSRSSADLNGAHRRLRAPRDRRGQGCRGRPRGGRGRRRARALDEAGVARSSLKAVAVGTPGIVDPRTGRGHARASARRLGGHPARGSPRTLVPVPRARRQRGAPVRARRALARRCARHRRRRLPPDRRRHRRGHPHRRRGLPRRAPARPARSVTCRFPTATTRAGRRARPLRARGRRQRLRAPGREAAGGSGRRGSA